MTLYRLLEGSHRYEEWKVVDDAWRIGEAPEGTIALQDMIGEETGEYMVPVEPCMHGKYDAHGGMGITFVWCLGAGLEDTK